MKKLLSLILGLALLCAGLAGCTASDTNSPASIKIGFAAYDQYDTFISVLTEHFQQYTREKEADTGMTITVAYGNADQSQVTQNYQVENFIREGCDIICVNLVDRTDASTIIDLAEASGTPILFFNRELVEEDLERWDKLYYVGAPAEDSGRIQGQIAVDCLASDFEAVDKNGDGVIQYVMLEGEAGHQDAIVRTEYSVRTVEDAGYAVQRLEDEIANWSSKQAETKMDKWLEVHGDNIEIVFANNDEMALGAINSLQKAGISPQDGPLVIGIDGTPAGLQAVLDGKMTGTVFQNAAGQARALLELAVHLYTGEPLPDDIPLQDDKYVRLPYQMVTPNNVSEFIF